VSFLDELKGLEDRVRERMGELRPLVAEYRELEQVAERLGIKTGDSVAEMQGVRAGAGRKPASGGGARAAAGPRRPSVGARGAGGHGVGIARAGQRPLDRARRAVRA
jgi:hypothetical protein